jgi:hypothetical protein
MDILGTNARDVPFAALYHVENAGGMLESRVVADQKAKKDSPQAKHLRQRLILPHPQISLSVSPELSVYLKAILPRPILSRSKCPLRHENLERRSDHLPIPSWDHQQYQVAHRYQEQADFLIPPPAHPQKRICGERSILGRFEMRS